MFHEELDRDVIRGKSSGLRDKSVQRRITNLSRNKTIEKVALHRCWIRESSVCESDDFIFSSTSRDALCNTGSSNSIAKSPWKCVYVLGIVSMDKILRLTNTFIIFKMRQCSSSQTGFLRVHPSTQTSWNYSRVVFLRWPLLLGDIFTLFKMLTCVHNRASRWWICCSMASRYWSDWCCFCDTVSMHMCTVAPWTFYFYFYEWITIA